MLTDKQIDLLKKSNKTIAIMGLFRSEDEEKRYVFSNSGEKDGKISVPDLFAKLQPELRSSNKGTLQIGDTIFNQYELDTPLNVGDEGNSQPILFDSPLLDGTIYTGEEAKGIQEQGKEVKNGRKERQKGKERRTGGDKRKEEEERGRNRMKGHTKQC